MIRLYVLGVCTLAAALIAVQDWAGLAHLVAREPWGFLALAALSLFAEHQAVVIGRGRASGGTSIGFLPLSTVLVLYGPAAPVAVMLLAGPAAEYLIRRKEPLRANFNIAQYLASSALGGLAYAVAGGFPVLSLAPAERSLQLLPLLGPVLLFGGTVLVVNNVAVASAIALSERMRFREVWDAVVGRAGVGILTDLLVAPVALAVAGLYVQFGTVGIVLAILPIVFVRNAYVTTLRLQEVNRDLLKALVKAIETRDPYTSGHSVRVARLSASIAERMGFSPRKVREIETAALLHDIGKIDGSYMHILEKRAALTADEQEVIESHVTKGAELIRSLTSFGDEILLPILHHHEHVDGTGYPEGLRGEEIPIGARIIKVGDAIDAMLTDRPYRKAMTEEAVRRQLEVHRDRHFDRQIVDIVLREGMVADHRKVVRGEKPVEELTPSLLATISATRQVGSPARAGTALPEAPVRALG